MLAAAALVAVSVQTGTAGAQSDSAARDGKADTGALPAKVTPKERAGLLRTADARAEGTADTLKLGGKEKLKVRNVVKNRDGATHTRYERTYAGLPVLGGEIIVHRAPDGSIESTDRANPLDITVPTT
ncbi:hypothetical protein G5C65_38285, partial [Streptomyces sp. SB3404]|nr:hypothetical protein [Streptomyces boncukensis]